MSEPFIGEIRMVGFNFAPRGWLLCNGQLLSIQQNSALFSLLGTMYGGNGTTTFALPNLQGRVPMHWGQGPGLTPRTIGEIGGQETVTLTGGQMPAHNHGLLASTGDGSAASPTGNVLGTEPTGTTALYNAGPPNTSMNPAAIGAAGGNQPHDNMQPYQCVTFIIATEGIYPSRP